MNSDLLIKLSDCKIIFTSPSIGKLSNTAILDALDKELHGTKSATTFQKVVLLKPEHQICRSFENYESFVANGAHVSDYELVTRMRSVTPTDVCNLQFTSGTTGSPKAAMLTHK